MNLAKTIAAAVALFSFAVGCSTFRNDSSLKLKVIAPPGTGFTCKYHFGEFSGSVKTTTTIQGDAIIVDIPVRDGTCEFTKEGSSVLTAVMVERGIERFSFRSSTNNAGFRLIREGGKWRTENIR